MPKFSATTLLRELEDYQSEEKWDDGMSVADLKDALGLRIVRDQLAESRKGRKKPVQVETLPVDADGK